MLTPQRMMHLVSDVQINEVKHHQWSNYLPLGRLVLASFWGTCILVWKVLILIARCTYSRWSKRGIASILKLTRSCGQINEWPIKILQFNNWIYYYKIHYRGTWPSPKATPYAHSRSLPSHYQLNLNKGWDHLREYDFMLYAPTGRISEAAEMVLLHQQVVVSEAECTYLVRPHDH